MTVCKVHAAPMGSGTAPDRMPTIAAIYIDIGEECEDSAHLVAMVRNLLFVNEGERFAPSKLTASVNALKLSEMFREISVDSREDGGQLTLIFTLAPFRRIKNVKIHGGYPLFEREILNTLTIFIGDAYIPEKVAGQEETVTRLFKDQGFIAPHVTVTAEQDTKDYHYTIHVSVKKGRYFRLRKMEITGTRAIGQASLKRKMKTWWAPLRPGSSGRFIEKTFKKDLEMLTAYYRARGYADAIVQPSVAKNTDTGDVDISLFITEGPRYVVNFTGNEEFQDYILRKDLVLFKDGNLNGLGLKKSIKKIKERYRHAGYLNTRIETEEAKTMENALPVRSIRFIVEEGPHTIVQSVTVTGNATIAEEAILKQILTRPPDFPHSGAFVPETLEEDIYAVRSLYLKEGYLTTEITDILTWSSDRRTVGIGLDIREGPRTFVSSLTIEGLTALPEESARTLLKLREGEPFRRYLIRSDENALSQAISEKGYPHVKVKAAATVTDDGTRADIVYRINKGPFVSMGHAYSSGNFRTKEKVILNELELEPGDPFSLNKMLQSQRRIRNLDIFSNVKFKTLGLKEREDTVNLIVDVEEKKPYFIEMGTGYESQRGFYAQGKAGDQNLFGLNKYGWISGEVSQIGYRSDLGISEPSLFGTHVLATAGLFTERVEEFNQDFGTKSYGASLGFARLWGRRINTSISFRLEQREQFLRDSASSAAPSADSEEFDSRSILVVTPFISYTTRDSFIRPTKGIFTSFSFDVSKGVRNSLDDFIKYRYDLRYYTTPLKRITFAFLGRAGYISSYGSGGQIPQDQLFFLGGTSTVRGYDENLLRYDADGTPIGGLSALLGSIEARIELGYNFELTTFYDTGSVADAPDDTGSSSFRSSVGLGLRYITPIGPIGILYGHKLDRREGESAGRFHFSIGYTF